MYILTFAAHPWPIEDFEASFAVHIMESASRLFGSPFRHFTGVKCEERPLRARANISLHLEGALC